MTEQENFFRALTQVMLATIRWRLILIGVFVLSYAALLIMVLT